MEAGRDTANPTVEGEILEKISGLGNCNERYFCFCFKTESLIDLRPLKYYKLKCKYELI